MILDKGGNMLHCNARYIAHHDDLVMKSRCSFTSCLQRVIGHTPHATRTRMIARRLADFKFTVPSETLGNHLLLPRRPCASPDLSVLANDPPLASSIWQSR